MCLLTENHLLALLSPVKNLSMHFTCCFPVFINLTDLILSAHFILYVLLLYASLALECETQWSKEQILWGVWNVQLIRSYIVFLVYREYIEKEVVLLRWNLRPTAFLLHEVHIAGQHFDQLRTNNKVWTMLNCFLLSYIICEVSYYQFQGGTVQRKCATCQMIYFCHFYSLPCLLLCASVFSHNHFHLHNQHLRKHSFC